LSLGKLAGDQGKNQMKLGDTTAALGAAILILKNIFKPAASIRN